MWIEIKVLYGRFGGWNIGSVRVYSEEGLRLDEGFERVEDDEYEEVIDRVVMSGLIKEIWVKRFEDMDVLMVKVRD